MYFRELSKISSYLNMKQSPQAWITLNVSFVTRFMPDMKVATFAEKYNNLIPELAL